METEETATTEETAALERRKLALEIAELERPWWKRPSYILAALPTLLAVVALTVGFLNGFFSAQLTKLENQKHDIEAQVKEFEAKRTQVQKDYEELKQEVKRKSDDLQRTKENLDLATKTLQEIETGLEPLKKPRR